MTMALRAYPIGRNDVRGDRTLRRRRRRAGWAVAVAIVLAASSGVAVRADEATEIVVCESLVALRLLTADRPEPAALSRHPGCRRIPRDALGAVEQRAIIGGAPFECLAIRDAPACGWVAP